MKLYDYLKINNDHEDFYDTVFDMSIYLNFMDEKEINDYYGKFYVFMLNNLEIKRNKLVDFYGFCKQNIEHFDLFASNNCYFSPNDYSDLDDKIELCINILYDLFIGNYSEPQYGSFLEIFQN